VSEVFHDIGGIFHHAGTEGRYLVQKRRNYASFASFSDPTATVGCSEEVKTLRTVTGHQSLGTEAKFDRDYDRKWVE